MYPSSSGFSRPDATLRRFLSRSVRPGETTSRRVQKRKKEWPFFSMDDHDCVTKERRGESNPIKLYIPCGSWFSDRDVRPPTFLFLNLPVYIWVIVRWSVLWTSGCIGNFEIIGKNSIKYIFKRLDRWRREIERGDWGLSNFVIRASRRLTSTNLNYVIMSNANVGSSPGWRSWNVNYKGL